MCQNEKKTPDFKMINLNKRESHRILFYIVLRYPGMLDIFMRSRCKISTLKLLFYKVKVCLAIK